MTQMATTPTSDEAPSQPRSLPRSIGYFTATSVVIANVIGSGIFTTTGFLARDLGSPFAILAIWLVGAVLALAGALCYSELGAAYPRAGGEYVYLREAYGPLTGFLTGWGSFVAGFSAPTAAACIGFAAYLAHFAPALGTGHMVGAIPLGYWTLRINGAQIVGLIALWTLTLFHAAGTRRGGQLQVILTAVKTLAIVSLIAAGLLYGHGDWTHLRASPTELISSSVWANAPVSLIFILFCYSGWNAAAYLAGDVREPHRTIPRSLLSGTAVVAALYIGMNILFLYALPVEQMSGVLTIGEKASQALFGDLGTSIASAFMAVSILSSASAMTMAGPRVYYAMATDGVFPRKLGELHATQGSPDAAPVAAIVAQSAWASVLMLTGTFEQLIVYSGFVLVFFSALAVAATMVLRFTQPTPPRPFRVPLYPLPPLLFIGFSAWILLFTLKGRPQESLAGIAMVLAGIPLYWHWSRKHRAN